jgi:hypothetical protein
MDSVSLRYCPSCGNPIHKTAKFCTSCGAIIDSNDTGKKITEAISKTWGGALIKKMSEAVDIHFPIDDGTSNCVHCGIELTYSNRTETTGLCQNCWNKDPSEDVCSVCYAPLSLPERALRTGICNRCWTQKQNEDTDFYVDDTPEEEVLLAVTQSKLMSGNYFYTHSIIVTERALKLEEPTILGQITMTEIPFEHIDSIKKIGGLFASTLKISAGTYGIIEMRGVSNRDADAVIGLVHKKQAELKLAVPPLSQESGIISVADEIQKLAALRDNGTITDYEFQTAKKRLLSGK